jgi:hypothetical protein
MHGVSSVFCFWLVLALLVTIAVTVGVSVSTHSSHARHFAKESLKRQTLPRQQHDYRVRVPLVMDSDAIDVHADPCSDFHRRACGHWKGPYVPEIAKVHFQRTLTRTIEHAPNTSPVGKFFRSCQHRHDKTEMQLERRYLEKTMLEPLKRVSDLPMILKRLEMAGFHITKPNATDLRAWRAAIATALKHLPFDETLTDCVAITQHVMPWYVQAEYAQRNYLRTKTAAERLGVHVAYVSQLTPPVELSTDRFLRNVNALRAITKNTPVWKPLVHIDNAWIVGGPLLEWPYYDPRMNDVSVQARIGSFLTNTSAGIASKDLHHYFYSWAQMYCGSPEIINNRLTYDTRFRMSFGCAQRTPSGHDRRR